MVRRMLFLCLLYSLTITLSAREGKTLTQLSFVMIMVVHGVIRGMRKT